MNVARIVLVSVVLAVAVTGCSSRTVVRDGSKTSTDPVVSPDSKKGGPSPHAPAQGYRYTHPEDGVVLVYDSRVAVYVVTGYNHTYFSNGVYFAYMNDTWRLSKRVAGPWKIVIERDVPPALKARYADYKDKMAKLKSDDAK
jgi:hypothetical protein